MIEAGFMNYLRDTLGAKLVAYLVGAKKTRELYTLGTEEWPMTREIAQRMVLSYHVAKTAQQGGAKPKLIQAWFQGENPRLDNQSPARVIRDNYSEDIGRKVLYAAREFAHYG